MSYQALARKWRPKQFAEVVGQNHVLQALIHALDHNRLHHAYLFTGTRGVGKTTLGRLLAKSLNCANGVSASPCDECTPCQEINAGRFIDLLEIDAASRTKVEDTRELLDNVQYAPTHGRYKVYLIDEVHMLSHHSFNALLKTLEEPPEHVKFILATTDPQRLPVTILSRCLQFNLKCIAVELIQQQLAHVLTQEQIEFENSALPLLSQAAQGSMRDALSLLDQAIAQGNGQVQADSVRLMLGSINRDHIYTLLDALNQQDAAKILTEIDQLAQHGIDFSAVLAELMAVLHQVAVAQLLPVEQVTDARFEQAAKVQPLAKKLLPEDVQLYYQIALMGARDLPFAFSDRSGFEMIILRMLAFRPVTVEEPAVAEKASPASHIGLVAQPPALRIESSLPRHNVVPSANIHLAKVSQNRVTEKNHSPTRPSSIPVPAPSSRPSDAPPLVLSTDGFSWQAVVQALKLTGVVRQLALNSAYVSHDDNNLHLTVQKNYTQLASRTMVERLQETLSTALQRPIRVHVSVDESTDQETPAMQATRQHDQRINAATQVVDANPVVQAMKIAFDAKVEPDSIRLVDDDT